MNPRDKPLAPYPKVRKGICRLCLCYRFLTRPELKASRAPCPGAPVTTQRYLAALAQP